MLAKYAELACRAQPQWMVLKSPKMLPKDDFLPPTPNFIPLGTFGTSPITGGFRTGFLIGTRTTAFAQGKRERPLKALVPAKAPRLADIKSGVGPFRSRGTAGKKNGGPFAPKPRTPGAKPRLVFSTGLSAAARQAVSRESVMRIANIPKAKANLSYLIKMVRETNEPVIIGKAGKPVAVLSAFEQACVSSAGATRPNRIILP